MLNRWLQPDHIADVLPMQAQHVEAIRRLLLDTAQSYGFELVIPPLVEHLDSLLIGADAHTGSALDLQTFKLVDQHSGRSLGVRADITPQAARIDAHLLNRQGLVRLCYCGPVLHTRPAAPQASREPLQFGAEIYGHSGLEADLEVMELALTSLAVEGSTDILIDLSDVRIAAALMSAYSIEASEQAFIYQALAAKDASLLAKTETLAVELRTHLTALLGLYGDWEVLAQARHILPALPAITMALDGLVWIAKRLVARGLDAKSIRIDLADLGGYGYYTGLRFALYSSAAKVALARGGRYDEVGAVFGRKRPAVGFSLDIKELVEALKAPAPKACIRMPWGDDPELRLAASALRRVGESLICVLPGHDHEVQEMTCDRELVREGNQWVVKSL